MLSKSPIVPRLRPQRVREAQRLIHLAVAAVLVAYVYLTPPPGSGTSLVVRWAVLPVLVLSGFALWKWTAMRRWARRRGSR
jgi:hypothetical protein